MEPVNNAPMEVEEIELQEQAPPTPKEEAQPTTQQESQKPPPEQIPVEPEKPKTDEDATKAPWYKRPSTIFFGGMMCCCLIIVIIVVVALGGSSGLSGAEILCEMNDFTEQ